MNKRRPGVSDLFSATALFFQFFYSCILSPRCPLINVHKQRIDMTERERERETSRLFGNVFDVCLTTFPFCPEPV